MSLTFLNPLLLFGLVGGILPILIHRLTKRKVIERKFSAVRLILQSQRITSRPQKLKHLLLLALRILTVLGIVFMMARPVFIREGLNILSSEGAKVIILDNSLSMGFREEMGERFELAKKAAKELLKDFKGQVTVIPTADVQTGDHPVKEIQWVKAEESLKTIDAFHLSFDRGNTTYAFNLAYQRLKDLKTSKQILILSDMAHKDWETLDLSKVGVVSDLEVAFLRLGGQERDSNFCTKGISLVEGDAVVGVHARLEVVVSNLSEKAGKTLVQLYLSGNKVDQKSVDVNANGDGKVYFELFLEKSGWMDGEVRLSEDRLPLDDVFYFSLKVREKVKVLIVDGDPSTSLKASESYYLVNALDPKGDENSPFLVKVITENEFGFIDLNSYDAIFLLNTFRPYVSMLTSFLELGRPIFIFLGDKILPSEYNAFNLFSWRLGELRELNQNPERVSKVNTGSETLRSFSKESESLKKASFWKYFRVEGITKSLLTLRNQDPLLLEKEIGKSKLFLFTSSADLDWNDLPIKSAYLPLIQGLLKETTGLTKHSLLVTLRIGDLSKSEVHPMQIKGSQGGPGIYQFSLPSGELRRGVNPPYEESDLMKMTQNELQKKFGTIPIKIAEYHEGTLKDLHGGRKELWPYILVFLLVILGVEMLLANGLPWKSYNLPSSH